MAVAGVESHVTMGVQYKEAEREMGGNGEDGGEGGLKQDREVGLEERHSPRGIEGQEEVARNGDAVQVQYMRYTEYGICVALGDKTIYVYDTADFALLKIMQP